MVAEPSACDPTAKVSRQDLLELDERPHGRLLDSGDGRAGSGPEADRDRDRLLVVQQQRRHRRPGAKPVAAGRPRERLDRVAEPRNRSTSRRIVRARHLEPVGELGPAQSRRAWSSDRSSSSRLEVVGHVDFMIAGIEDRF